MKKILVAIGCFVLSAPLVAHHGAANVYDMSKPVVLKGTITKFEWTNPHNQIYFDVTDEKGTVSHDVLQEVRAAVGNAADTSRSRSRRGLPTHPP